MITREKAALLKLNLLAEGVSFSDSFLLKFSCAYSFMEKRKVYNNPDEGGIGVDVRIPQEIVINDVVIAVKYKANSRWVLDYDDVNEYFIKENGFYITKISFTPRPRFLDASTPNGVTCAYVANLYGGKHLAFFTPAYCSYNKHNEGCLFCSLKSNRKPNDEYAYVISGQVVNDVTRCALAYDKDLIEGVMLVGGNMSDEDEGFLTFLDLAEEIEAAQINQEGRVIWETHIATMPPKNIKLLERVKNFHARITMNIEVYDDALFSKYCPGKDARFGRGKIISSLKEAAKILDYGKVHSILIAGLEPAESTVEGIHFLAEMGVCPIVNVFHNDYGTALQDYPRPKFEDLHYIGKELQKVYREYRFTPYWDGCGRNSLDYEAKEGLFL